MDNSILTNSVLTLSLLILAVLRIYLEVVKFDFLALPISKMMASRMGSEHVKRFHKTGLILSIGYIILFAPTQLFY